MNIYAYKNTSKGARLLSSLLQVNLINHKNSVFKGGPGKVVLNWGASEIPKEVRKCKLINNPDAVECVVDRHNLFANLSTKFDIPAFTKDVEHAAMWVDAGNEVFEKNGTYTLDVKATSVFRVHQFPGKSVYVQYKTEKVDIHEATRTLIKETCEEVRQFLSLDFCAITIGWNKETGRYYILGVNTAPALDEKLGEIYAREIRILC